MARVRGRLCDAVLICGALSRVCRVGSPPCNRTRGITTREAALDGEVGRICLLKNQRYSYQCSAGCPEAIAGARTSITVVAFNEWQDGALLLRRRNPILVGRITVVTGADEGEYFPKIIRIFDQ